MVLGRCLIVRYLDPFGKARNMLGLRLKAIRRNMVLQTQNTPNSLSHQALKVRVQLRQNHRSPDAKTNESDQMSTESFVVAVGFPCQTLMPVDSP